MRNIFILILIFVLFSKGILAQATFSTTSKKAIGLYLDADNFRVHGEFDKAIDLLNQAISKDKNFEEAYFRLGLTFKNKEDIKLSCENFEKGLSLTTDAKRQKNYQYELGENYLSLGSYLKCKEILNQFLQLEKMNNKKIDQASLWLLQADYALAHANEKLDYKNQVLSDSVNSYPNQYFPALTADNQELLFTVRYGSGTSDNEDIVISRKDKKGEWTKPVSISDQINSKLQEGACSVSADGHQLIFTMCGGVTYGRCDLFESKKVGEIWSRPTNLGPLVNSPEWEGQPSLSADGRVLYFSSSRKGGLGGYDIWMATKDEAGKWTKAQNLGNQINTKFDEISPFIHVNNQTLYFASNGYAGFGGYDIYQSDKLKMGWATPLNLGYPLNDFEDQFSFFVTSDGSKAYFSKADVGNHGLSKIYQTTIPEKIQIRRKSYTVKGAVRDNETGRPIKARIELTSVIDNEKISVLESDSLDGSYLFVLTKGANYSLFVSANGYLFKTYTFHVDSTSKPVPIQLDIDLKPIRPRASAVLNNIFFDVNKFDVKPESFSELENAIKFLQLNSTLTIEVAGHTDNAGLEEYNLKLSQKRAQAVIDYLVQKGIDKQRLQSNGYGSTKPVAKNDTEANRQLNRRIEFVIIR